MSISIRNSQVRVFVYVPPMEKCVRPTLCPFRVRTHQVLLRTHVCECVREREGGRERARGSRKNIEDESPVRVGSPQQEFNSGVILQYYPIISWKKNRYIWTQCDKLHLQLMLMKGKTFFAKNFYFSMFYNFDSNIVKATSIGFVSSGFALFG